MTNSKIDKNLASKITIGTGNIFADLGLPNPEEMLVKAQLAKQIYICITERNLTQSEAATILGIDQPKVSNLINGKLAAFSIDRLFRFLTTLDCNIEISIKTKPLEQPIARVVVLN
jgi:predicted XRE-type DNA-binding protein